MTGWRWCGWGRMLAVQIWQCTNNVTRVFSAPLKAAAADNKIVVFKKWNMNTDTNAGWQHLHFPRTHTYGNMVDDTHTHLCISCNNRICKELMSNTPTPVSLFSLTLSLSVSLWLHCTHKHTHNYAHTWVAVVSFCESELSEGTVWAFVKTENCRGREIHFQLRQKKAFLGKSHCTCSVLKTAACKLN